LQASPLELDLLSVVSIENQQCVPKTWQHRQPGLQSFSLQKFTFFKEDPCAMDLFIENTR
jgi:hypothetical protein